MNLIVAVAVAQVIRHAGHGTLALQVAHHDENFRVDDPSFVGGLKQFIHTRLMELLHGAEHVPPVQSCCLLVLGSYSRMGWHQLRLAPRAWLVRPKVVHIAVL